MKTIEVNFTVGEAEITATVGYWTGISAGAVLRMWDSKTLEPIDQITCPLEYFQAAHDAAKIAQRCLINQRQGRPQLKKHMTFETIPQAAERLGLAISTVREYCQHGRIPGATKPGRDWMIPADATISPPTRPAGRPRRKQQ